MSEIEENKEIRDEDENSETPPTEEDDKEGDASNIEEVIKRKQTPHDLLLENYESQILSLPSSLRTVGAVLFSIVISVGMEYSSDNGVDIELVLKIPPSHQYLARDSNLNEYNQPQQLISSEFSISGENSTFKSLLKGVFNTEKTNFDGTVLVEASDNISHQLLRSCNDLSSNKSDINYTITPKDLFAFEKQALLRRQITHILGSHGNSLPLIPELTSVERSIKESELSSFTSLSTTDMFRYNKLQMFDTMMLDCSAILPNFTGTLLKADGEGGSLLKRRYFRNISAFTFAQILAKDTMRDPKIIKQYYPLTDELLMVLYWPPPDRRTSKVTWNPLKGTSPIVSEEFFKEVIKKIVKYENNKNEDEDNNDEKKKDEDEENNEEEEKEGEEKEEVGSEEDGDEDDEAREERLERIAKKKQDALEKRKKEEMERALVEKNKPNPFLQSLCENTITITPAGRSIVTIKESPLSGQSWLSIFVEDSILGLRADNASKIRKPIVDPNKKVQEVVDERIKGDCSFFCHTEDDVRIVVSKGPNPKPCLKPDKYGTMCLVITMPIGMIVSACSNGVIRISNKNIKINSKIDQMGKESIRYTCAGASIVRRLEDGLYTHDIISPLGCRTFFRNTSPDGLDMDPTGFHKKLMYGAPRDWTYVRLDNDGGVNFFTCPPGTVPESKPTRGDIPVSKMMKSSIDAETLAHVYSFSDGRVIVIHQDGMKEVIISDGTRIMTNPDGMAVYITKEGYPSIEIDLQIETMCLGHSKGLQVPLAKGGERIRARVALIDGSALMIKYDTRITAKANGSLKLVRRDRSSILVSDNGIVSYSPKIAWGKEAASIFALECEDTHPLISDNKSIADGTMQKSVVTFATSTNTDYQNGINTSKILSINGDKNSVTSNNLSDTSTKKKSNKKTKISITQQGDDSITKDAKNDQEEHILDTKFKFNIFSSTCSIEDHEYNCFDINLQNPLNPKLSLAGEVEGLKPTAVTDTPMDPRLFVVNRSADATEVLSINDVNDLENMHKLCPDAKKFVSDVSAQHSDLGDSRNHSYFIKRKLGTKSNNFTFSEVFAERPWQNRSCPATASLLLYSIKKSNSTSSSKNQPSIFQVVSLAEHNPLSIEGYNNLSKSILTCDNFKSNRAHSIDRFHVEDLRSQSDLDLEDKIKDRLKKEYKKAKANATKKKEQIKEAAMKAAQQESGKSLELQLGLMHSLAEGDDEEEDGSVSMSDSDNDSMKDDPDEYELHEAFVSFAVIEPGHPSHKQTLYNENGEEAHNYTHHNHHYHEHIVYNDLRSALIQILNCDVPQGIINSLLIRYFKYKLGDQEYIMTFDDFRHLYERSKVSLDPTSFVNEDEEDNEFFSVNLLRNENEENNDLFDGTNFNNSVSKNDNDGGLDTLSQTSMSAYWNTDEGKEVIKSIPQSAPPLDLRKLDWSDNFDNQDEQILSMKTVPVAGSALQAARNRTSKKIMLNN